MNTITKLLQQYQDNTKAKDAIRLIVHTQQSVFLTGKAGTGKSWLLKALTPILNKKHIILAPTEVAALQAGGENIHTFFGFEWRAFLPTDLDIPPLSQSRIALLEEVDLIIIDEISMVRCDLMNAIDLSLRKNLGIDLPFAGKQLLMIGDLYQLPPILNEKDKETVQLLRTHYSSRYFFSAKAFDQDFEYQIVELAKVYRQRDKKFISLLNAIRMNQMNDEHLQLLNQRCVTIPEGDSKYRITLATSNAIVSKLNEEKLAAIEGDLYEVAAQQKGRFSNVGSNFPTDSMIYLKIGAQIMFVRDDEEGRWVNGTLGKVLEVTQQYILVEIKEINTKIQHKVARHTWYKTIYNWNIAAEAIEKEIIGTFTQFPIKLAWGITIHKSQGQTFDNVIINMGSKAFATGQTYVALSRCTSFKGIVLKRPIGPEDIFVDKRITRFLEAQKQYRADKNSYITMLEHTERSIQQQQIILSSLEETVEKHHEETSKIVRQLVEKAKRLDWLESDAGSAQKNLKEVEAKLGLALSQLAKKEAEVVEVRSSTLLLKLIIGIAAVIILYLLF